MEGFLNQNYSSAKINGKNKLKPPAALDKRGYTQILKPTPRGVVINLSFRVGDYSSLYHFEERSDEKSCNKYTPRGVVYMDYVYMKKLYLFR